MMKKANVILGFGTALVLLTALLLLAGCGSEVSGSRAALATDSTIEGPGETSDNGIVHGTAKLGSAAKVLAQSVVALVAETGRDRALCTGSIIAKDLILTAAHCVEGSPDRVIVVFAENVEKSLADVRREADGYVLNPHWRHGWDRGKGDMALVHFTGKLPAGYHPLKLAPADLKLKSGSSVMMMGYGVSDGSSKEGSGVLRSLKTKVIETVSPTEILSDGQTSSVCFGDSGGPAFIKHGETWVQWGVASSVTNRNCSEASVHTTVMDYMDWIGGASAGLRR